MNKVILIGNISTDIDLRFTPGNGTPVAKFNIAVNEYNSAEKKNVPVFIPVVIWGKQAESTAQYCQKGSKISVSGRISVRSYDDKEGNKRYVTEVIADNFGGIGFLSFKNNGQDNSAPAGENTGFGGEPPVDYGNMPF